MNDNELVSPKQRRRKASSSKIYPYYAGFSDEFVISAFKKYGVTNKDFVLDPWNGAGTTTKVSAENGVRSCGIDINPAMYIVSNANNCVQVSKEYFDEMHFKLMQNVDACNLFVIDEFDPLLQWFDRNTSICIRKIERAISRTFLYEKSADFFALNDCDKYISSVFLVSLFLVLRKHARSLIKSNPTWIKVPNFLARISIDSNSIIRDWVFVIFEQFRSRLIDNLTRDTQVSALVLGNCATFTAPERKFNFVLTSPPYATRIDYVRKTAIELAVIFPVFRIEAGKYDEEFLGTTKVRGHDIEVGDFLGDYAVNFLNLVRAHPTKSSDGYYVKFFERYIVNYQKSLNNISNICASDSLMIFVVQDSFYKNIRFNLM